MPFTCLIVDDEQPARELLKSYVEKMPQLQLVALCKNAMEAKVALEQQEVDLMLLDIQMPDLSGVELLKTLRSRPATIFTTAYQEYALEGYQVDVVDYLLKPFSFSRFVQAIDKAIARVEAESGIMQKSGNAPESMVIKADHKLHKIILSDIRYIEGLREYVTYHLAHTKVISLESLKSIEHKLKDHGFVRAHKSFIVNKKWVQVLDGNQLKIGEHNIPVGASYKEEVVRKIFG